jgi:hypothetical protein
MATPRHHTKWRVGAARLGLWRLCDCHPPCASSVRHDLPADPTHVPAYCALCTATTPPPVGDAVLQRVRNGNGVGSMQPLRRVRGRSVRRTVRRPAVRSQDYQGACGGTLPLLSLRGVRACAIGVRPAHGWRVDVLSLLLPLHSDAGCGLPSLLSRCHNGHRVHAVMSTMPF